MQQTLLCFLVDNPRSFEQSLLLHDHHAMRDIKELAKVFLFGVLFLAMDT